MPPVPPPPPPTLPLPTHELRPAQVVRPAPSPAPHIVLGRLLKVGHLTARKLAKPAALTVIAHGLHLLQGNVFVRAIDNIRGDDGVAGGPDRRGRGRHPSRGGTAILSLAPLRASAPDVVKPLVGAIGITAIELAVQYRRRKAWRELALDFRAELRAALIGSIAAQDLAFFDRHGTGALLDLVTADTQAIGDLVERLPDQAIEKAMTAVFAAVTLIRLSPKFALTAALPLPLLVVPSVVLGPRIARRFAASGAIRAEHAQALESMLSGITDVKLFQAEGRTTARLRDIGERMNAASLSGASAASAMGLATQAIGAASVALVAAHGGALTREGRINSEDFARILYLYPMLLGAVGDILGLVGTYQEAASAASRVGAIWEARPTIVSGPVRLPAAEGTGRIVLDRVSFGYDDSRMILRDVSFEARRGETIAIVGRTGSGKSTLLRLIARLYDVTGGRIELDGRDVRELDLSDLRETVALVSQDTYLFEGSIRDNLRYGKPLASDVELRAAMAGAGAGDLLGRLPEGLDEQVGERGGHLSGGERQRVAIARTILRDAPILLLDEITSHLDYETEDRIRRTVDRLAGGRTIVIVTHRLATIRGATRIVVLDAGRVAEVGTHRELVAAGGVYAKLWRLQTGASMARVRRAGVDPKGG